MRHLITVLLLFVLIDALSYNEHLQFKQLQHTTYTQYLRALAQRKRRFQIYKSALAVNPQPVLKILFFDNDTKIGDTPAQAGANFVGIEQASTRPVTVDDEIGLPLNQPLGDKSQKTQFYNWAQLYNNYYNSHPNYYGNGR
ncbi:unnamed protein product [Caenorhabditis auriculariae]|uniref:Uncharacterized protein n=1 Tax=Caenorhabditis auriculariae TaxID=2777116 RepID=A0A8S1HWC1_9PELO|nr:unnamed protein product [Caenorhabditis auriculariae]